jgi:hypothetical protein
VLLLANSFRYKTHTTTISDVGDGGADDAVAEEQDPDF